jgi:hypothetical protein
MVNIERLELAMKQIMTEPERHYQEQFGIRIFDAGGGCRTAYCLAGWGAITAGATEPSFDGPYGMALGWRINPDTLESSIAYGVHIAGWAQEYFGLSELQADTLFHPHNTRTRLRAMVDRLIVDPNDQLRDILDA